MSESELKRDGEFRRSDKNDCKDLSPGYCFNKFCKGILLVFNQIKIASGDEYENEKNKAEAMIRTYFKDFFSEIIVRFNKSAAEIKEELRLVSNIEKDKYNLLAVLMITTSKNSTHFYAAKSTEYTLNDVLNYFYADSCPAFQNKPKLLILQAPKHDFDSDYGRDEDNISYIPAEADILVIQIRYTSTRTDVIQIDDVKKLFSHFKHYHDSIFTPLTGYLDEMKHIIAGNKTVESIPIMYFSTLRKSLSIKNLSSLIVVDYQLLKGKMLVFNQTFKGQGDRERKGTEVDVQNIKTHFRNIGLKVKVYDDLKKAEILETIEEAAEALPKDYNCLGVFVMTHGDKNRQLHAKDKMYSESHIESSMQCTNTNGKLKLLMIQSCRGDETSIPVKFDSESGSRMEKLTETKKLGVQLEQSYNMDTIIMNACYYDTKAFRHIKEGSIFVQSITYNIVNMEKSVTIPLLDFLVLVAKEASKPQCLNVIQMPTIVSNLTLNIAIKKTEET